MEKHELTQYYKAANLFVLPTREDIWGLVINEAMSFGLPVITTNKCNAGLELLDEDCGLIIDNVENPVLYSNAINSIINGSLKFSSEHIIKKINDYTIESMAKRVFDIIKL